MARSQMRKVQTQGYASDGKPVSGGVQSPAFRPPTLASISPNTAVHGGADLVMTCTGTGFEKWSRIVFNLGVEFTNFISATSVTTTVKPSLVGAAIAVPVYVQNGYYKSENRTFTFT